MDARVMPAHDGQRFRPVVSGQHVTPYLAHIVYSAQRHADIEFAPDQRNRLRHSGLAAGAQAIEIGAAYEAGPCAQRERPQHVLARANAAVEQELDLAADRLDYFWQGRD